MQRAATGEKKAIDLTSAHRWFLLILVSVGSSTIYAPAYLKNTFYDAQMSSLQITNAQVGGLLSAYAITATICYLPSGLVADRVRVRTLSAAGFILTSLLTVLYAMLPSYGVLVALFIGMGVTTILIWWGVRYKLVRLISEEKDYSKNIGLSYGFYGAAGLVVGLLGTWILSALGDNQQVAFRTFLLVLAGLIFVLGVLSYLFIPKFEGELLPTNRPMEVILDALRSLANPVVLICAVTMFFVYFFYTGITYTTPFLKNVVGASDNMTNIVSVFRTYGVTLLAGPVFGALAHKAKSPSRIIWIGSAIMVAGLATLALMPMNSGMVFVVVVLAIGLGFIANGVFGIVSAQLTEGKVALSTFGAATGVVSVVGFLPDSFSSTWFGSMLDAKPEGIEQGPIYSQIFWILAASALIAAAAAMALRWYVKKNSDNLIVAQAEAEAAVVAARAA
ncbi:Predicted arabinose efflux permease, MFS family [Sanguibacter gelidistatuariae]|uniref:Predicted arabinose efflux permease, MFS family n=1 Tax=Sanguibacter gelidistatuariae TaxID=1814289 RepID=A0A1G6MZI4_9MICO|nr:MFS transporter [Sanguibacter gelidistatuariae]SDC60654.1 Predicted arabinose efflux permease, MFS family [Sanguibacter gelidistatuariae]